MIQQQSINPDYYKAAFEQPVPGESLTSSPEAPWPWEKPPQYTTVQEASEFLFTQLTEEENYVNLLEVAGGGVPLMNIARVMLTDGFQNGLWNPDLLLILIEPLVYMMAALLERADVDFVIEYDTDEENTGLEKEGADLETLRQLQRKNLIPEEIEEKLSEFNPGEPQQQMPMQEEEEEQAPSLLERSE